MEMVEGKKRSKMTRLLCEKQLSGCLEANLK